MESAAQMPPPVIWKDSVGRPDAAPISETSLGALAASFGHGGVGGRENGFQAKAGGRPFLSSFRPEHAAS